MKRGRRAFTLVEVLTAIAIIATLFALLLPSLSAARAAANRAGTKVRFHEWGAAIEAFRAEYGYYPQFPASGLVNDGADGSAGGDHLFHDVLAGRHRDGSALAAGGAPLSAAGQNPRFIRFNSFGESEFNSAGLLQDASGGTEIAVLVDTDLDGFLKPGVDFPALPAVHGADGSAMTPGPDDFPAAGLRAGVAFYAPDPRATAGHPALVLSWK